MSRSCPLSDTARPAAVTISYTSWTPSHYKVNSIPYVTSLLALRNGLLLDTPTYIHDRSTSTSTEIKGARGLKPDKSHAWKRRRKRRKESRRVADTARPAAATTSCTSPTTHALKAEVTEAWRRRRKKRSKKTSTQRYYRPQSSGTTAPAVLPPPRAAVLPPQLLPEARKPEFGQSTCRSGTTARRRAVLPPKRYYRLPGAVLPVLRDGFPCDPSLLYPFVA